MDSDSFTVTFITPALLSGANPREADPIGLRGTSLRGMWRFWARALWRGLKPDINVEEMKKLEAGLFGDTKSRSFRIKIKAHKNDFIGKAYPLPHKPKRKKNGTSYHPYIGAIKEDSTFEITIYWPPSWCNEYKKALASTIVLWSVLGSIGQRSRRGFGSVRLHDGDGFFNLKTLFEQNNIEYPQTFQSKKALETLVKNIVSKTADLHIDYMNKLDVKGAHNRINKPLNGMTLKDMFFLQSCEQILVGKVLGNSLYDMQKINNGEKDKTGVIYKVHGIRNANRDEHGDGPNRLASPIYIRLHIVNEKFVPLAVLSYRVHGDEFQTEFKNWLDTLGLGQFYNQNYSPSSGRAAIEV